MNSDIIKAIELELSDSGFCVTSVHRLWTKSWLDQMAYLFKILPSGFEGVRQARTRTHLLSSTRERKLQKRMSRVQFISKQAKIGIEQLQPEMQKDDKDD